MTETGQNVDQLAINTLRFLAVDMVEKAKFIGEDNNWYGKPSSFHKRNADKI